MRALFPNLAQVVDDLCVVRSMGGSHSRHGAAVLELCTGSDVFVRPSRVARLGYGLGTENQNLPAFIIICPNPSLGGALGALAAFGLAFLPTDYQGTPIGNAVTSSERARIPLIENAENLPPGVHRVELDFLQTLKRTHVESLGRDSALEARIASFELAFRMQTEAPEVQDLSRESEGIQRMYGLDGLVDHNKNASSVPIHSGAAARVYGVWTEGLLGTQRSDRVKSRGFSCGIKTKKNPDGEAHTESHSHGGCGHQAAKIQEPPHHAGAAYA